LFTYRVTNRCLRTSQPQQQPATIAVTAAARQCSVSKHIHSLNSLFNTQKQYTVSNIFTHRFKVMIGVALSVGIVHSATQCGVNAKRFRNCSIYCKNTYFASGHKPSLLPRDNCTISRDVTPSVAVRTWGCPLPPTHHTRRRHRLHIVPKLSVANTTTPVMIKAALRLVRQKQL